EFEALLADCLDPPAATALFSRLLEETSRNEEEPARDAAMIFAGIVDMACRSLAFGFVRITDRPAQHTAKSRLTVLFKTLLAGLLF
ncbi:AraC family transcriptional regulator, partial [Rhizobium leguminosarum]